MSLSIMVFIIQNDQHKRMSMKSVENQYEGQELL